jgi:hypothetical protein
LRWRMVDVGGGGVFCDTTFLPTDLRLNITKNGGPPIVWALP